MLILSRQAVPLAFLVALSFSQSLLAQQTRSENQCLLKVNGSQLSLKHYVAFTNGTSSDAKTIVLITGNKLSVDKLKRIKEEDADDSIGGILDQNHLKMAFESDGELSSVCGNVDGSIFFKSTVSGMSPATIAAGRIQGEMKLIEEGRFAKDFVVKFDLPVDGDLPADQPVKLAAPVNVSIAGKFTGQGKPSNLKYLVVRSREAFADKEAIQLIFCEKDPAKSKDPAFDASFRKLGNALVLSVDVEGGIFGCEVIHSAHSKGPFSSVGEIKMVEFDLSTGNVIGHVSTGGVREFFKQTWDVDLKFAAPLPEKMRQAMSHPTTNTPETKTATKPSRPTTNAPRAEVPAKAATPLIAARKLALPADAKNVQYKALVKHIAFDSGLSVSRVAAEFSSKLKAQGWKEEAGSLMGQKNAILKRAQGQAKLTIMIQPTMTGSQVKIFTEGLDWETGSAEDNSTTKPKSDPLSNEIEKKAQELIKKTLEGLPPGFLDEDDK